MIKTSIIIPVYNTQAYLEECIDSIFSQTQNDIEVIAVNDGSTDGSLSELERIQKKYPQLIVIDQQNQGPGQARNTGMKAAKGEYIYFCDSDDFLCNNNALEKCYQYAKKYEIDVVMFDAEICGDLCGGRKNFYNRKDIITTQYEPVHSEKFIQENFRKVFCPSPDLIYIRAGLLSENNIYFKEKLYYEDNLFYCTLMMHAENVLYIPEAYYGRRYRKNSIMTSSFDKKHLQDGLVVAEAIERLECSTNIKQDFHDIAVDNLKGLLEMGIQNNLFSDEENAEKIYESATNICGKEAYRESDILYRSTVLYGQENMELKSMRIRNLEELLAKLMFERGDIIVGIYGIGKEAERLFREYESSFGQIRAKLVYIISDSTNTYYRNQKVVGIAELADMELEYILITSSSYEQEMEKITKDLYGDKFQIVKLCGDLRF